MAKKFPGTTGASRPGLMPGMNRREQQSRDLPYRNLPQSKNMEVLERAGINGNRIDKHGTPGGLDAKFNKLPPGMDIANQENANIRKQPFLRFRGYEDGYTSAGNSEFGAGAGYFKEDEV